MNFDLNINNYKLSELEEMFDLPYDYNENVFFNKESKLRTKIMSNNGITNDLKPKILAFIADAKEKIMQYFRKNKTTQNGFTNLNQSSNSNSLLINNNFNAQDNILAFSGASTSSPVAAPLGGSLIANAANPPNPNIPDTPFQTTKNPLLLPQSNEKFMNANLSEFFAGSLNPLNSRVIWNQLNIDTRFRDNYYSTQSSNFNLTLPMKFSQVVTMSLWAIEFPPLPLISPPFGNNFFVIKIGQLKEVIFIGEGKYTASSLQQYLNERMSNFATSPNPDLHIFQYIYFTIDNISDSGNSGTNKMIVGVSTAYTGSEPLIFSLLFNTDKHGNEDRITPLPLKLGWIFGFRNGEYVNNPIYISEGKVDLQGIKYLYLVIDDFNNNVCDGFYGAFNSSILNKNILARITLSGSVLGSNNTGFIADIFNTAYTAATPRHYFGPVDVCKLNIQVLDEVGRVIDMVNMDYSFCLTLQTVVDL